ncbi:MAG: glucose-6-phosphate isomerase, partial [Candidatus Omnitrophica bacterium]|nr:glucose-6-phosphate isomerase [Candidatus Omnitrophota bacterium]
MTIRLNTDYLKNFISAHDLEAVVPFVQLAHENLHNKKGKGSEFCGWFDLPSRIPDALINELSLLAQEVKQNSDAIVSIGIGGSYLGIRATVEFLGAGDLPIYYAGHNISSDYLYQLLHSLENKRVTVVVISKSGTTTEPAIAFRVIKALL